MIKWFVRAANKYFIVPGVFAKTSDERFQTITGIIFPGNTATGKQT